MNRQERDLESWASKILITGATLSIFLMLVRAQIANLYSWSLWSALKLLPRMFFAAYYDLLYVTTITFLFLIFLLTVRNHRTIQRLLWHAYRAIAVFSLIAALANVELVKVLGRPLNYQWLYYSDFMGSVDLHNALWSSDSRWVLVVALVMSLILLIVSRLAQKVIENFHPKHLRVTGIVCFTIYFPFATFWVKDRYGDSSKLENPVVFFFQSVLRSWQNPALFTMNTPLVFDDLSEAPNAALTPLPIKKPTGKGVRNVVIVVLESVPAEYIDAYGKAFSVSPDLNRYRQQSALFTSIYAHAPASNESLVSILLSIYPWISYRSLTREYPKIAFPSLSTELKRHGYRTGFFSSGDTRFQNTDVFLSHHQIDRIQDYRSLSCNGKMWINSTEKWPFLDSTDDECLVEPVMEWVSKSPEVPFFAMLWTTNTHYPYYVVGKELDFGVKDPSLNRYLNALRHTDQVLGQLLRRLESRQLLDSTLFVVVGDHGEAFGRHQQIVHAAKIYEENVHVPLILINQTLFSGEDYGTIGGLVDLAPTIMHILNHPVPTQWQGRSLFSPHKKNRTYFFAARSIFLFGYREGDRKHIFNATLNSLNKEGESVKGAKELTDEIYDLREDPTEMTNLAEQLPNALKVGQHRLAAWVQYHNRFMKSLLVEQGK
jgi:lipoteichoic acid synthase